MCCHVLSPASLPPSLSVFRPSRLCACLPIFLPSCRFCVIFHHRFSISPQYLWTFIVSRMCWSCVTLAVPRFSYGENPTSRTSAAGMFPVSTTWWFDPQKRVRYLTSLDRLSERFVSYWANGRLGPFMTLFFYSCYVSDLKIPNELARWRVKAKDSYVAVLGTFLRMNVSTVHRVHVRLVLSFSIHCRAF